MVLSSVEFLATTGINDPKLGNFYSFTLNLTCNCGGMFPGCMLF